MPYPIFSLQDVDPRFNENATTNDAEIMRQANELREARRKYQKQLKRRVTSAASVVGGGISLIPHPVAKVIGGLLQVPDVYYDAKDVYDNPSSKTNWGHIILDGLNTVPGATTILYDDILKAPGIVDDGYNALTGRDVIDDTRRKLYTTSKNKKSIKDKSNNKK